MAPPPAKRPRAGPAPEGGGGGGDAETAKRGLIAVNNLRYELAPDLSVVVSRTMHSQIFHTDSYSAPQRMVTQWNSGSSYIDPQNSYLEFDLEVTHKNTHRVCFGNGSATSLFRDVSIVSRSGDEIERSEHIWNIMPEQDRMHRPTDWFKTVGSLAGYNEQPYAGTYTPFLGGAAVVTAAATGTTAGNRAAYSNTSLLSTGNVYGTRAVISDANTVGYAASDKNAVYAQLVGAEPGNMSTTAPTPLVDVAHISYESELTSKQEVALKTDMVTKKRFIIPLSSLSQFFRTTDKLIPAALASGLRVEFQLNQNLLPFRTYIPNATSVAPATNDGNAPINWDADASVSYKITSPRMLLDSYQLTDSIQRAMNETIASSGVEMPFVASYHNRFSGGGSLSSFNIEVRKAVSRALTLVVKPSVTLGQNSALLDAHNTPTSGYLPGTGFNLKSYQVRVGSLHFPHQPISGDNAASVTKSLYHHTIRSGASAFKRPNAPGSLSWSRFSSDGQVVWTDLERSSVQNLTGIPINNSRVVELALACQNGNLNAGMELNLYLFYVRLVRVFLNNVEVEE